jgi:hypothetical protein
MKQIFIRNIFVDIFLFYYFKHAYNVAYAMMIMENHQAEYIDNLHLRGIFASIEEKIRKVTVYNQRSFSFLNLAVLLNLRQESAYPVVFNLTIEESEWFSKIVSLSMNDYVFLCHKSNEIPALRRLYPIPEQHVEEFLSVFNNKHAVDYIRQKFLVGERISIF